MTVTSDTLYAGDPIRMSVTFETSLGVATDPTTVTFTFVSPDGSTTTFIYGTDAAAVKDSTGNYHCDRTTTTGQWGTWEAKCVGTGTLPKTVAERWLVEPAL